MEIEYSAHSSPLKTSYHPKSGTTSLRPFLTRHPLPAANIQHSPRGATNSPWRRTMTHGQMKLKDVQILRGPLEAISICATWRIHYQL